MNKNTHHIILTLCLAAPALAQEIQAPPSSYIKYSPLSGSFTCEIPSSGWHGFEEETPHGYSTHIMGPKNPAGNFRTGIDVHFFEKGGAGSLDAKKAIDKMRKSSSNISRRATPIRPTRIAGFPGRLFEIEETRALPADKLPAKEEVLHYFVAVVQSQESYYVVKLASSRDIYLDLRNEFLRFLKHFKPLGAK